MTSTRSRRSGGTPKSTTPADEQPAGETAPTDGPSIAEQAATTEKLPAQGDPAPAEVDAGLVRPETGLSPEVANGPTLTAATGDDERNGKATAIPTDTSGELRHVEGDPVTAAHGHTARNGQPVEMIEQQSNREFGGNGDPTARLVGSGVRGDQGVGTLDPNIGPDERPTYPSTTLTRSSSSATPMEPEDAKHATEPKLGVVETSTDPVAAASAVQSHTGDVLVKLVDLTGAEVKPSEFFEVPEEPGAARGFMRVKHRVSEVFTVWNSKTPSQRLLFLEGQLVPVQAAQTLIELQG